MPAAAHDGDPGLVAIPNPVNPGGTIEIRGDNLGADEAVSIALLVDGQAVALVSGTTDGEGHLTTYATTPADIPPAIYVLQAEAAGGYVATGSIELSGVPLAPLPDGDPYERGPIGTAPPITDPGAGTSPGVPVGPSTASADILILVAAVALPLAGGLAFMSRRRRRIARN
jgi:hypothetical protein